jgi:hypothetical protein
MRRDGTPPFRFEPPSDGSAYRRLLFRSQIVKELAILSTGKTWIGMVQASSSVVARYSCVNSSPAGIR